MTKCNLCKIEESEYQENVYTSLCLHCWSIIRVNQGIEAVNHPMFNIWRFDGGKIIE